MPVVPSALLAVLVVALTSLGPLSTDFYLPALPAIARDVRELEGIYRLLDELEPIERDKRYYRPRTELYPWPLGAALLLSGLIYLARRHQASA